MSDNAALIGLVAICVLSAAALKWKGRDGAAWFFFLAVFIMIFVRPHP